MLRDDNIGGGVAMNSGRATKQLGRVSQQFSAEECGDSRVNRSSREQGIRLHIVLLLVPAVLVMMATACGTGLSEEDVQAQIEAALAAARPAVQAERFEVVDSAGEVRALLTTLDDGRPSLTLMDQQGEFRAWLFLNEEGSPRLILVDRPLLVLADQKEDFRSVLRLDADGSPSLAFNDSTGSARAVLELTEIGGPEFRIRNGDGQLIWSAPEGQ